MASIVIAGRTLEVRNSTLGLLRKDVYPWLIRADTLAKLERELDFEQASVEKQRAST